MSLLQDTRITIQRGAPPDADVVFVSTDINGTSGELNRDVLRQLKLDESRLPGRAQLSRGYSIQKTEAVTLVYLVTVNGKSVRDNLTKNLGNALASLNIVGGDHLWIPLMGIGAGGLTGLQSLSAILDAIEDEGSIWESGANVTISAPNTMSGTEYEALIQFYQRRLGIFPEEMQAGQSASDSNREQRQFPGQPSLVYGPDLWALVEVAGELSVHRVDPSKFLSTSLLMFALVSTDREGVPQVLVGSAAARHFASALKELAGSAFRKAWDDYFLTSSGAARPSDRRTSQMLPMTKNAAAWFQDAALITQNTGRTVVSVADLIAAFWEQGHGRVYSVLAAMNVPLKDLLTEYEQRLLAREPLDPTERNIYEHLIHDHATNEDLMDFNQYALAIANFLTSSDTHGPISISIQAPWGAGKSSLMHQVRHILDAEANVARQKGHATIGNVVRFLNRKTTRVTGSQTESETKSETAKSAKKASKEKGWTVWFNAWKYESSEQVWAGLVDAIISQVSDRLPPADRELFLLRLNLARIDDGEVRKRIYDKLAAYWWVGARWLLLLGAAVPAGFVALGNGEPGLVATWTSGGLGLALTLWLAKSWSKVLDEPSTFSLAEYVRVPDYGKSVGVVHQIHQDLQRVIEILPKLVPTDGGPAVTQPLVIFVDDLDRCSPNKVASIVEGINTFLASDQPEFMFVIGMDPQMVAAALEHAHKDVKSYLPSYEQSAPLGWRFMDKFIQLAFTIPPRRSPAIEGFVTSLTRPVVKRSEVDEAVSPNPPSVPPAVPALYSAAKEKPSTAEAAGLQQAVSKTVTNESEDVRTMMAGITREFFCSPREIKRILNFVRFVLLLRIGRISRQEAVPALEFYQRWILLCIRWPDMARWVQWGAGVPRPGMEDPPLDGLTAQRLSILELAAFEPGNELQNWGTSAARNLGLVENKVSWLADPELHRFFMSEAAREPAKRLSRGASVGFY